MNADGSNRARLTDSLRAEYAPNWSPDGTSIVFERTNYWNPTRPPMCGRWHQTVRK